MFDIGFQEFVLIGIVALVVVGPERLPAVAASVGRWVGKTRRFVAGVKSDFAKELESGDLQKILGDQKDQINELRSLVNSTRKDLESSSSEALAAAKSKLDSAEQLTKNSLTGGSLTGDSTSSSATSDSPTHDSVDDLSTTTADNLPEVGTPIPVPEELKTPAGPTPPEEPAPPEELNKIEPDKNQADEPKG